MPIYSRTYTKGGPKHWFFDISIRRKRYRGALPEARTKAQAEQAEQQIRTEIFENRFGHGQLAPRLSTFFNDVYLPWARDNKRSSRDDQSRAAGFLKMLGEKAMDEITSWDVDRFKKARISTKTHRGHERAPKTVNHEIQLLARLYNFANERGMQLENPCKKVRLLQADSRRTRHLTHEEEAELMPWLSGRRVHIKPIVILAIHTGMRQGELMNLKWENIDFQRSVIYVVHRKGQTTKTGKGRTLPMNSIVRQTLLSLHNKRTDDERVWSIKCPKRSFAFACQKAGIKDFRFHDLRHTFATRAGDAGATAFEIAALLGHSAVTMTAIYTHATSDGIRRAVEGLTRQNELVTARFGHEKAATS